MFTRPKIAPLHFPEAFSPWEIQFQGWFLDLLDISCGVNYKASYTDVIFRGDLPSQFLVQNQNTHKLNTSTTKNNTKTYIKITNICKSKAMKLKSGLVAFHTISGLLYSPRMYTGDRQKTDRRDSTSVGVTRSWLNGSPSTRSHGEWLMTCSLDDPTSNWMSSTDFYTCSTTASW